MSVFDYNNAINNEAQNTVRMRQLMDAVIEASRTRNANVDNVESDTSADAIQFAASHQPNTLPSNDIQLSPSHQSNQLNFNQEYEDPALAEVLRAIPSAEALNAIIPKRVETQSFKKPTALSQYEDAIRLAAQAANIPPEIALAVASRASGGKGNNIFGVSDVAYKDLGLTKGKSAIDSINAGVAFLEKLYNRYGNWDDALTHYYSGGRGVARKKKATADDLSNKRLSRIVNYATDILSDANNWK